LGLAHLTKFPVLNDILKYGGAVYMLFLPGKSRPPSRRRSTLLLTKSPSRSYKPAHCNGSSQGWAMASASFRPIQQLADYPTNILLMLDALFVLAMFIRQWVGMGNLQKFLHKPNIVRG